MLLKDKRPCVVAGLVATLTFGVTLAAAPAAALADMTAGQTPEAGVETLAVVPDEPVLMPVVTDAPEPADSEAAASPETLAPVADAPAANVEPGAEASGEGLAEPDPQPEVEGQPSASAEGTEQPEGADEASEGASAATGGGATVGPEAEESAETEGDETEADAATLADEAAGTAAPSADEQSAPADGVELEAGRANQWVSDGNGSYRWYDASGNTQSGWLVTDVAVDNTKGGLQRYWLGDGGSAVMGLFEAAINGISSWFFGTDSGYVVRGAWTDPTTGNVYLADNEGRLEDPGWVVSDEYGQGLQRYWIDEDAHAAVPGLSEDGWAHYTTDAGYVLRGGMTSSDGAMRYADNDGRLQESGWLVTDDFGQSLQRYWLEDYEVVKDRLIDASEAGWAAYATKEGYVVRGAVTLSDGSMRYADNDGRLQESGWLVTDGFGQGLQRYWLRAFQVVKDALISAREAGWEAYATKEGYVLRGAISYGDGVLLANNDGMLESGTGWLVTDRYAGTLQRYYLSRSADNLYSYATVGFFEANLPGFGYAWFYGDADHGYVTRGRVKAANGMLLATNDGVLIESLPAVHEGFCATDQFDGAFQLYYLKEIGGHLYAQTGVFSVGSKKYFGLPDTAHLVRGKTPYGGGMIIAAGDGTLYFQDESGFVVTNEVDGALQRYYIVDLGDGVRGAKLGLFTVGSDQYYGREDQGYVVRGTYTTPGGVTIYGDEDGKVTYSFLTPAGWAAWDRVNKYPGGMYSLTKYLLTVDTTNNRVVVFQGTYIPSLTWYGNWTPLYDWSCSTGNKIYHDGQGTPTGIYRIGGNADYNWNESGNYTPGGYRTTYWRINDVTYFTGFLLNLGFHSTVGYQGGYSDPNQLGKHITHGCIRLAESSAKWIYDNALPGTKVYIF